MLYEINNEQYNMAFDKINQLYKITLITLDEKAELEKLIEQLLYGNMTKANILYQAMNLYLHEHVKRILKATLEEN
ncbi:hypothetical protein ACQKCU_21190 [Heyndrickxia sporothermodurans]